MALEEQHASGGYVSPLCLPVSFRPNGQIMPPAVLKPEGFDVMAGRVEFEVPCVVAGPGYMVECEYAIKIS